MNPPIAPHSYSLSYGSRQFAVIPKRVIRSIEFEQAFKQLLIERVPQIVRRSSCGILAVEELSVKTI